MKGKTLNNKYEVVILNYEISEKPFKEFEFKEKKMIKQPTKSSQPSLKKDLIKLKMILTFLKKNLMFKNIKF